MTRFLATLGYFFRDFKVAPFSAAFCWNSDGKSGAERVGIKGVGFRNRATEFCLFDLAAGVQSGQRSAKIFQGTSSRRHNILALLLNAPPRRRKTRKRTVQTLTFSFWSASTILQTRSSKSSNTGLLLKSQIFLNSLQAFSALPFTIRNRGDSGRNLPKTFTIFSF